MVTFIASLLFLILGYILYGAFVNKVFGADSQRKTPCYTSQDGVDYIPMPTWKVFLIQFLNSKATFKVKFQLHVQILSYLLTHNSRKLMQLP
jgi:carbon starvation protein CstA